MIEKVDDPFPESIGQEGPGLAAVARDVRFFQAFEQDAQAVVAEGDGYLQKIDGDALMALASAKGLVIRLTRKPGSYIVAGCPLVLISPASRVTDQLAKQVQSLFVTGSQRTSDQDIEFTVDQLVEMAVRALSPGLNDPFTAIACVDFLGSALCRLAARDMPSSFRYDHKKQLRLIARADAFPGIVDAAFNQIRQYGRSSVAVTIRLLETIAVIAEFAFRPDDRASLLRHAEMIARGAREELPEAADRRAVEDRWQAIRRLCVEPGAA